ncbi:hypothetical protein IPN35_00855 [Candidatus Peregrinibacteria bacterium]|nr:MAG: hypothetical protein IPN35_00855 [Candidatus Peregrinibacteria bacterium]
MKKILPVLLTLFCFLPLSAYAAYSDGVNTLLNWADTEISEISAEFSTISQESENPAKDEICVLETDWEISFTARLQLGASDFFRSVNMFRAKNNCLVEDVHEIENRIWRLYKTSTYLKLKCRSPELSERLSKVSGRAELLMQQLFFFRDAVQDYGGLEKEEEQRAHLMEQFRKKFQKIPEGLPETLTFSSEEYKNQQTCPEPKSYFSFHQTKEKFAKIMEKIKNLMNVANGSEKLSSLFFSGAPSTSWNNMRARAEQRGKQAANRWFQRNISSPVHQAERGLFKEGSITQEENRMSFDETKQTKAISDAPPAPKTIEEEVRENPITEKAILATESSEKNRKNSQAFLEEAHRQMTRIGSFDHSVSDTLDKSPVAAIVSIRETNEHLEKVVQALNDFCGSLPTCQ